MSFTPTPRPRPRRGFTLIELLTVIAIIGILAAITIPVLGKVRASAKNSHCKSNLKQLGTAYLLYVNDNKGKVPTDGGGTVWCQQIDPYMIKVAGDEMRKMYQCPSVEVDPTALWWQSDYGANVHGAVRDASFTTTAPAMLDKISNPSQVIAFLDWIPKWRFARAFEYARANGADKDKVFRHNGRVNAVFVDGHVGTIAWPIPTDHTKTPWR